MDAACVHAEIPDLLESEVLMGGMELLQVAPGVCHMMCCCVQR